MKRKKQNNTLIVILEWICGFSLILAVITTTWACFVYKDRNGSFLPKTINASTLDYHESKTLPAISTPIPDAKNLQLDPNATSETPAPQQASGESIKNVSIAGFKTLSIAAETTEVSVNFYNPSSNEGEFLMTFELLLPAVGEGSYESVYSSGLVEAGNHITAITLSRPVARGTYENCILRIQPYFVSDRSPANTAEVCFTLFAQ